MPTVRITIQSIQIIHDLCPQGIQMDIPDQFLQIGIFLAYDGFVSILEKLAMTLVPSIVGHCIAGKQPSH
jgi:hypothetical protein